MRFSCDQRWDDLEVRDTDRFCLNCQKPVIDFTGWERDALVAWFKDCPDTCGMFRAEQVDPSLIAMKEVDLGVRKSLFVAMAALSFTAAEAQQVRPPAPVIEQVPHDTSHPLPLAQPEQPTIERCWVEKESVAMDTQAHRRAPRRKLYVSKRFPFVHLRRQRTLGRIAMGCPSF